MIAGTRFLPEGKIKQAQKLFARLPFAPDFKKLCIIFAVWTVAIIGISYFATNELHVISDYESNAVIQTNSLPNVKAPSLLAGLPRWDSEWYLDIALHGYHPDHPITSPTDAQAGKPAFFPLYPALLRGVIKLHINPVLAGVSMNVVLGFGSLLFVYLLALELLKDRKLAIRAGLLFLVFPSSFFLLGVYSEALFCFLTFGAFYFALRRKWLVANIFLAFCTATRSPAAFVALAVFIEYLHSREFNWRKLDRNIFTFLLAPLGLFAYMAYLQLAFHDPLAMLHDQKYWSQGFDPNLPHTIWRQTVGVIRNFITPGYNEFGTGWTKEWTNFIVYVSWLAAVATGIKLWFSKLPKSLAVYTLISALYFISKGNFISVSRYVLPLFPMYLLAALFLKKRDEYAFSLTLMVSCCLMVFGLVEYAISYWAG